MYTLIGIDVPAGIQDVGGMCFEDETCSFPASGTGGSTEMPALHASLRGEAFYQSFSPALLPSTETHRHAALSNVYSSASMPCDAAWGEHLSAAAGQQQVATLLPTTSPYVPISNMTFSSVPAAHRGDVQHLSPHSIVAATDIDTSAHLDPYMLRHVSSGLSSNSTMTPARSDFETVIASRPDQYQTYDFPAFPASLVSGSSRKRKALVDTSPVMPGRVLQFSYWGCASTYSATRFGQTWCAAPKCAATAACIS